MSEPERGEVDHGATEHAVRRALIVIDMQNAFVHPDGAFARHGFVLADPNRVVVAVNELVASAGAGGSPVVWVRMVWNDLDEGGRLAKRSSMARTGLLRGTWEAEFFEGLAIDSTAKFVEKVRFSAFHRTKLEEWLRAKHVQGLVVVGVRTDYCVESTVRDAFFRDFEVTVVTEAVAGYDDDLHHHSLREMASIFADVVPLDRGCELLGGKTAP